MTKTLTLDEILEDLAGGSYSDRDHGDLREYRIPTAKQAILQWVADEVVGDVKSLSKNEVWGKTANIVGEHIVGKQRQILKAHDWKEPSHE